MHTLAGEEFLSPLGTALRLGVSPATARRLMDTGRITCIVTPLGRLALVESVEKLVAERATGDSGDAA